MGRGLKSFYRKGGSGGKRGHSNMEHHEHTEIIKSDSKKARRIDSKTIERTAMHNPDKMD